MWAVATHFYLWTLPLVLLQPIDVLDRLGLHLVIPDEAVYVLVAGGVFLSVVDAFHGNRLQIRDLAERESARSIVGMLYVEPGVGVDQVTATTSTLQPYLRFNNRSDRPITYRVDAMSAILGSDASPPRGNRQPVILAPQSAMDYRGTTVPNVANGQSLDLKIACDYRFGLVLASSVVKMAQRYEAVVELRGNGTVQIRPWTVTEEPPAFEVVDARSVAGISGSGLR